MRLETLVLKKSSNNEVFEEISKDFEKLLLSDEFKEENERASLLDRPENSFTIKHGTSHTTHR